MIIKSKEIETRTVDYVADLMCAAARTAPKAKGVDNLVTMIVKGREKDQIAEEMSNIAKASGMEFFERDAKCVEKAALLVLLGQKLKPLGVSPCGYCGYEDCGDNIKNFGICTVGIGDLGIAVGSAVSVAALHHIDNRVMFSIGRATLNLGIFEEDIKIAYGIPLSISGKSPFHDR